MKSLILGGMGFVEPFLEKELLKLGGMEVLITKSKDTNYASELSNVINFDILNQGEVINVLAEFKPDWIFQLAGQSSVGQSWENPSQTVDINIKGTLNVLEAIKDLDYKPRVLLVGTGDEYGQIEQSNLSINEESNTRPGNVFAATKAFQSKLANIYCDAYGLEIMSARTFNYIGPGQESVFAIANFCQQIVDIEKGVQDPIIKVGNLTARRDFTDIRDIVKAYVLLIQNGHAGEIYNVGSGRAIALDEILDTILKHAQEEVTITVDRDKLRPIDIPVIEADITKLKNNINWHPEYSIEATIVEMLEYLRQGE